MLLLSFSSQSLTARTTHIIHGNAPYLTFDGGQTRVTDTTKLLGIILSDGRTFTANNNSSITPIILPNLGETLANVDMLVPIGADSISLTSIIGSPYNYWGDDDGDGQENNGISATGYLSLTITDKDNQTVSRNSTLDICRAPYKITLTSNDGILSTQYGVPSSSHFTGSHATYYINPNESSKVCFVAPILFPGSNTEVNGIDFRGPPSIWLANKGFIPQSTTLSTYNLNFPTTGMHDLYFDLDIGGARVLTWDSVERGGITATLIPDSTGSRVTVKLTGPSAKDFQLNSDLPGSVAKPVLPQTFELVGKDSQGNPLIKYGFQLKQWYVHRGANNYYTYPSTLSWCSNIGYRLPQIKDLTNAICAGPWWDEECQGSVSATPSSNGNNFQRVIGGGFFSEWGQMDKYISSFYDNHNYWTLDFVETDRLSHFSVHSNNGHIARHKNEVVLRGMCTTP
ncbi:hypothetical protein [Gilliamella apis]|uniref:hypothetical protein n=1 Tax=Gilliamella apis TaxID=1970738 RepID=UPI000A33768F|nr:hypothetical protein [Gilliamella apis]OTQ81310.1 hypothetical protein B6D14_01325 [Gilliamella apis]